jgi:glucan-binding YG repeat protein
MYNPEYNWTQTYTIDQIDAQLKSRGIITAGDKFTKINTSTIKYYTSGRVSSIDLVYTDSTGAEKTITRTKDGARSFLPLLSTMYTVLYNEAAGSYTFTGKGNGHGIGMSQDGAQQAALQGLKYDAILGFYYTGTQIQKATSTLSSVTLSKTSVQAGESLTITANAAGGSGSGYFYLYEISKNGVQVYSSGSVNNSSIQYTPAESGDYVIKVSVMDALTKAEAGYDDTKTVSFTAAGSGGQTIPDGWVYKNNSWYLYKNNNYLTGWQYVNNKWYYLDNAGIMETGWLLDGTTWYFLDNSGAMATGWRLVGGKWYFLRSSGAMATGWIQSGSKWYYLYNSGAMAYSTYIGIYKLDASGAWVN